MNAGEATGNKTPKYGHCVTAPIAVGMIVLAAVAAWAQSGAPAPSGTQGKPETVVVTGHKTQQDIDAIVSQFVDLHAATNRKTGQ